MTYHIVAIPEEKDLNLLNNLRNYIYQNDYRFKNKPITTDTHITLTEVNTDDIQILKNKLESISRTLKPFTIYQKEWELTKKDIQPNYKIDKPYTWIALIFPQRKEIYTKLNSITKDMGINNNDNYINNVKRIAGLIKDEECIANHINLANYTKREKADECWNYFKENLSGSIGFDRIALKDNEGKLFFKVGLD
jgi:hypothetical protein